MSRTARLRDGLLLAVGTLLVLPVPAPRVVDRAVGAVAMSLAPLVGAALGAVVAAVAALALLVGVPPLVTAVLVVGGVALATRFLHLDGLADTADGLVVPGDRARALEVMRRGDVGPVGVAVLVLVLLGQVAALGELLAAERSADVGSRLGLLVLALAVSRAVLPVVTARGVRAARPDGLGRAVVGATPRWVPVVVAVVLALPATLLLGAAGSAAVLVGLAAGAAVAATAHRRLGGLTGDVLGAAVEVSLLGALVAAAALH